MKVKLKLNATQLTTFIAIFKECYAVAKNIEYEGFHNLMMHSIITDVQQSLLNKAISISTNLDLKKVYTISLKTHQAAIIYHLITDMISDYEFPAFTQYTQNVRTLISMDLHKQLSNQQTILLK